ncbi:MAG TPA: diaminopimelate epimerase [Bryobacteraceae bacterium]|nr:diaminopimelate epimerase [Bryobacteraceae bacterium]
MKIPFTKAHGAGNDFLLTWDTDVPPGPLPDLATAICERHTGIGADGWMLVSRSQDSESEGAIRLFNSDGSEPEISGNGTRCAAAFLILAGLAGERIRIRTGAGVKHLRLLQRSGLEFQFEMNMGRPEYQADRFDLPLRSGPRDVTLVWVGNPQCAVPVADFDFDWRAMGAEIESHPHFPNRTNVSFLRAVDRHTLEVRYYERGAGETMSSGTGSTGAYATALRRGWIDSPARILTPAGPIDLRGQDEIYLTGPAQVIGEGQFFVGE